MRFLNSILIKLCLGFILGIYFGFFNLFSLNILIYLGSSLIVLLIVFRWLWRFKTIFLALSVLLFTVLGSITTYLHLPENQSQHIAQINFNTSEDLSIQAEVSEVLRSNDYSHKLVLNHIKLIDEFYKGKILWNVSKNIDVTALQPGQEVLLYTQLNPFQDPKNPQSFDYARFMKNRNVYAAIYEDHFDLLSGHNFSLNTLGAEQRYKITSALKRAGFKDRHLELMQALILGQKQAIDRETYSDFAEVGVVHILAVSGLHVGIVLLILQFLLRPLRRIRKYGRPMIVIFSIFGLWAFAALAGFSPSVMRASTMFTFLAFGQLFRRKTNSINMLCLSALVLLFFRPQFLFEVGFQLSYAAVFAIVMLYPVFSKLYQPKFKIFKIFTDTAYVSLAAQIGVLPFQLFYFHQFPGLFLLGNIVVIPLLGVLLSAGIACIVLALLDILISPVVKLYSTFLDALIWFVDWLSAFKALLFQDIFFTKPMFIAIILVVFAFMIMIREFKIKQISVFLCSALAFVIVNIFDISKTQGISELIIFQKSRQTLIGVKQGQNLSVYSDTLPLAENSYLLDNYKLLNRVKLSKFDSLQNFYRMPKQHLIVVDSSGAYTNGPQENIILLTGSPDIHLGKLIQKLKPKQIVADGNNYKSYVERWRETSEKHMVPFYSTYEKGALSFKLHF